MFNFSTKIWSDHRLNTSAILNLLSDRGVAKAQIDWCCLTPIYICTQHEYIKKSTFPHSLVAQHHPLQHASATLQSTQHPTAPQLNSENLPDLTCYFDLPEHQLEKGLPHLLSSHQLPSLEPDEDIFTKCPRTSRVTCKELPMLNHFECIFMSLTCRLMIRLHKIVTSFYTSVGNQIMMAVRQLGKCWFESRMAQKPSELR